MEGKIVGILACMLLIATAIPVVSGIENKLQMLSLGMVDQT